MSAVVSRRCLSPRLLCSNNNNIQNLATLHHLSLDTWTSAAAGGASHSNVLDSSTPPSSSCLSNMNNNDDNNNHNNNDVTTTSVADFWMQANSEKLTRLMPSLMCERKGKRPAPDDEDELRLQLNDDDKSGARRPR